jgi:hypothetical protein
MFDNQLGPALRVQRAYLAQVTSKIDRPGQKIFVEIPFVEL